MKIEEPQTDHVFIAQAEYDYFVQDGRRMRIVYPEGRAIYAQRMLELEKYHRQMEAFMAGREPLPDPPIPSSLRPIYYIEVDVE